MEILILALLLFLGIILIIIEILFIPGTTIFGIIGLVSIFSSDYLSYTYFGTEFAIIYSIFKEGGVIAPRYYIFLIPSIIIIIAMSIDFRNTQYLRSSQLEGSLIVFASNNLLPYPIHVDLKSIFVVASGVFQFPYIQWVFNF